MSWLQRAVPSPTLSCCTSVMLSAATGLGVGLLPVGWSAGQESSCLVPRSPLGIYAAGSLLHPARPGRNPWQELWKCCRLLKLFRCLSGCVFLCDFFFFYIAVFLESLRKAW